MQTNLMQCAAVWSDHWQDDPPPLQPLQQCWQHSHVYFPNTTSGYDAEHCAHQLLWSTMARPVLSGTCPVKPLYDLGHRAAAQFQGLGNLLIAYAIFMYSNTYFFQILRKFFAMRCHVELPVRAITPNLTHLLPIHTWDLVTLTSHMTLGRENS